MDSGIDVQHPDLDDLDDNPSTNDPKVVRWVDYVNGRSSPYHFHGTHVAGTISGTGANGVQTGVAPGTKLIAAKVFDSSGSGYTSNVILAFEWAVNNGARVISYSGGGSHYTPYKIAIDNVVAAGVTPVVSAGNSGPGSNTISCPGDELKVITIGATDSSDTIASFSSRGSVTLDGQTYKKPDVSAPGVSIPSTIPVRYGYSYYSLSGTSMAAPHVSGTIALMLEENPTLKPSEIKRKLEITAMDLGSSGKDNSYGSGRIDAFKAIFNLQAAPDPQITSITPTQTSVGNFDLTIRGTNFDSGALAQIYWRADGHLVGQGIIKTRSATKLVVAQSMIGATPGAYIVKVKNSDGQKSSGATLTMKAKRK